MKIKQRVIILILSIFICNVIFPVSSVWARRIKRDIIIFSAEIIERNVAEWEDCGLPFAVISEIDGQALKQPITIVKKPTLITTFYRHLACKILGDYFLSLGVYKIKHIPPLITWGNGCYYYLYSEGLSHYPLEVRGKEVKLAEWDEFNTAFREAGFFTDMDITRGEKAELSNNIILDHSLEEAVLSKAEELNFWMRIDFEFSSFPSPLKGALIHNELWDNFLATHHEDLQQQLGQEKFELLNLCVTALKNLGKLSGSQEQVLKALFSQYQRELLREYFPD